MWTGTRPLNKRKNIWGSDSDDDKPVRKRKLSSSEEDEGGEGEEAIDEFDESIGEDKPDDAKADPLNDTIADFGPGEKPPVEFRKKLKKYFGFDNFRLGWETEGKQIMKKYRGL